MDDYVARITDKKLTQYFEWDQNWW